jgi:hypothetical protein
VHWGTRSAYIYTCSFQPTSRIGSITYGRKASAIGPWRGFTTSTDNDC